MNSSDTKRSHLGALIAALSLFTRLPFWRLRELTKADYEDALSWWPVAGLVTATTSRGASTSTHSYYPRWEQRWP